MNEKQLSLFLTVADQGSFSKAEEIAYISKQAMLRQINSLEAEIGVRLLDRSAGGVRLTPAGREFYQGAGELLALREEVLSRCRGLGPTPRCCGSGRWSIRPSSTGSPTPFPPNIPTSIFRRSSIPTTAGNTG